MENQSVAHVVTLLNLILVTLGVLIGFWQVLKNQRLERERHARAVWQEYLKLAFENPDYAYPDVEALRAAPQKYEQYVWFVFFLIEACATILATLKKSDIGSEWEEILKANLSYHHLFLKQYYQGRHAILVTGRLKVLINKAVEFGEKYTSEKYGAPLNRERLGIGHVFFRVFERS